MIPKIIHLCWFSKSNYPVEIKVCLDSWKKILPEYKIHLWDYEEAKAIGCAYIDEALSVQRWAFAADAVRFYAVYKYGGVYMDSDIFLYRRFDEFIPSSGAATFHEKLNDADTLFGLQAAFIIGSPGNKFCKDVFDCYASKHYIKPDNSHDDIISPYVMKMVAEKYGYVNSDNTQHLDGLTVYPTKYLSPKKTYKHHPDVIGVHRIYGSWRKRKLSRRIEIWVKHQYLCVRYLLLKR